MAVITADEVAVDLLARYDKLERQLAQAENVVDRRLGGMESRAQAFAGRFTGFFAGISAAALVGELAKLSDTAKQVDAQLKLATASFGSYGKAQEDVRRIAADARAGLEETGSLYGSFVRTSDEIGRSQKEAAQATETFTKALKIGGAGTQQVQSATLQMGQALASANVQWEELGQILEASPRLAKVFTDALGVTRAQLKQMAEDGKLSGEMLFDALNRREITRGIDAEFKTLPTTFGDAMTQIQNAAVLTFGAFDKGGQFSNALTNMLTEGTASFKGLEQAAQRYGESNRAVIDGIVATFNTLKGEASATASATGDQFDALSSTLSTVFNPLGSNATTVFSAVRKEADYTVQTIANILSGIDQLRNFLPDLQRRAQQFDERTFGRRTGFTGDLGPRSQLSEQFRQQVARSRIATSNGRLAEPAPAVNRSTRSVRSSIATPSASKGAGAGKSQEQRDAEKAATDFVKLIADVNADLREGLARTSDLVTTESERLAKSRRNTQSIFGREGEDYADPFAGVKDYDEERKARFEAAADAEQQIQDMRVDRIHDLADLYGDLFTRGSDEVWRNFKDQGLRTIALLLAQATVNSFSPGGGGLGSLLGNIGKAASNLFGGARAAGGPVSAGRTYLVGERGPELLTMGGQSGFVTPNNQLGSSIAALTAVNATAGRSTPPAAMPPIVIKIASRKGDAFEAEVLSVTGPQTVQILREAAPRLMDAATVQTMAELRKQNMRL